MTPQNVSDLKSAIQLLWIQGLKKEAIAYEQNARKQGIVGIGSCHTEEMLDNFITCDSDMLRMKDEIRILEPLNEPVLIRGETGTGKELVANALHGSRGPVCENGATLQSNTGLVRGRFVAINCPALSVDLMASTLFGHVKGSFTGAILDKVGAFQYAWKGTLFIDEIGDMPLSMQAAILRALQEKVITRVGSNEDIKIECRIVCATNKNLEQMVEKGEFRLDLLQRINTFELHTKPLRNRVEDIKLFVKKEDKRGNFPIEKVGELKGNVRELQSMLKRWNVLGRI
jgi:transcriptional regulator with GAF, ATPase, and Fis domain